MPEGLLSRVALCRIQFNQTSDQVLRVLGYVLPIRRIEAELAKSDLAQHLGIRVAEERRVATEHDIHYDAHAPEIGELVILALQHLRSDVVRRASLRLHVLAFMELAGQAEVDDFQRALIDAIFVLKEEVLGFQISVADVGFMHVVDGFDDLLHQSSSLHLREVTTLDDSVKELTARAQLHDQINVPVILERLVQLDDVRVVHHLHDGNLQLEPLHILHRCLGDGLDGPLAAPGLGRLGRALADGAVGALTELPLVNVVAVADVARVVYDEGSMRETSHPGGPPMPANRGLVGGRRLHQSRRALGAPSHDRLERQAAT
mmetsp:Transcript_88776/g.286900  ORF Transcript_88776/g.286900 Transcript_88776/m.286900 type:complete len:318 (-) Transcript_88776:65-1018(-)